MQNNAQNNQALFENLMQRLSEDDRKKLESVLSDKAACEKILSTPEAQRLMRELGEKPNG